MFYSEELLAPRQAPKLENRSLSAIRYCLFSTHIRSNPPYLEAVSIRNQRTRHAMVARGQTEIAAETTEPSSEKNFRCYTVINYLDKIYRPL
jgi:hypothetical protein